MNYFFLRFKFILEVESIEAFIVLAIAVQIRVRLTLRLTTFSFPGLPLIRPETNSRKIVHRPACFSIVHDCKFRLIFFRFVVVLCREVKPIGVSCGVDIVMQQKTMHVLQMRCCG